MSEHAVKVNINADMSGFSSGIRRALGAIHKFELAFMDKRQRRRHLRRCSTCSPFANPKPLTFEAGRRR